MRYPASEKLEIIQLVEQSARCGVRWKRSAFRAPPSIAGMICTRAAGRKLWTIDPPSRLASGTVFRMMSVSASFDWRWTK